MKALILAAGLLLASTSAHALQVNLLTGPQDPSQMNATINGVINQINAIITPLIPNVPSAVNFVSLRPATTGNMVTIGMQAGGDTNASIGIIPSGTGDIVLFNNTGAAVTGMLKFANSPAFVRSTGLAACPGAAQKGAPLGVGDHIRGYLATKDWLDRKMYIPACGQAGLKPF